MTSILALKGEEGGPLNADEHNLSCVLGLRRCDSDKGGGGQKIEKNYGRHIWQPPKNIFREGKANLSRPTLRTFSILF